MIQTKPRTPAHAAVHRRLLKIALPLAFLFSLSGCTELERFLAKPEPQPAPEPQVAAQPEPEPAPIPKPQEKPKPGKLYEWDGNGRMVTHIVVDTNDQKARFYDGEEQIGWTTVASGVSRHPTPVGEFEVMEKVKNKRSNLYGKIVNSGGKVIRAGAKAGQHSVPAGGRFLGAKMPYFLRLTYDGVGMHAGPIPRPGRPASHGCIRMPRKMAPILYKHTDLGTRVSIVGKGPDYGNYAAKQRELAAERARIAEQEREAQAQAPTRMASATMPAPAPAPARQPRVVTRTSMQKTHAGGTTAATGQGSIAATADDKSATEPSTAVPAQTTTDARVSAPGMQTMPSTPVAEATAPSPAPAAAATPVPVTPQPATTAATPTPAPYPPVVPAGAYGPPPVMQPIMPATPAQAAPKPAVAASEATPEGTPATTAETVADQGSSSAN